MKSVEICSKRVDSLNVYHEAKINYLKEINGYTEGQYKKVAIQIVNDVINEAANNKDDINLLEKHIDQTLELLLDLKHAINRTGSVWNKNEKIDHLYQDHNWYDGIKPWEHDISHEVDIVLLNEIISKYVSYKWFSSPTFEWFIINAYLRYCIELNRKKIMHSQPGSARSIAACCSTRLQYITTFFVFKTIGIILNWILPVSFMIFSFMKGWLITTIVSAMIVLVPFAFSIITFPARRKLQREELRTLADLISLKTHVTEKLWSPTFVMSKVKNLNQEFLMPELVPFVSKMIKRDPDIFNVSNGL